MNPSLNRNLFFLSYVSMALLAFIALKFNLLPAVISGFIVFLLIDSISDRLVIRMQQKSAKFIAVSLISLLVIGLFSLFVIFLLYFIKSGNDNLLLLTTKLSSILQDLKSILPENIYNSLPNTAFEIQEYLLSYLKVHSSTLSQWGTGGLKTIIHVLMGAILGAIVAWCHYRNGQYKIFAQKMVDRLTVFANSFEDIVFSQIKISALNTTLTGIFLWGVLPLFDVHLEYVKTMIVITFLAGLIPVLGNLISNTVITLIALGNSLFAAIICLVYLIIIHKLEYFVNAKIIGDRIRAKPWEILIAMLMMEAMFGIQGIIAAPIFYAYIKAELLKNNMV